ncbi:pentapeptide repeat-containing protein [Bradyrhizobium erythrophlei]|uniref:Pentapeptide repeat-containing protein n=1 Tax=Bradyrhizobium erythrophlei TaxID=1437360 RepID=A0A1M5M6E3_9BRAD|nr:pentapeptide repeat-containing protein [Bradyrhizobium erythrophlei]SHG72861.1 Pentapeptide repeat-containing protein [Bradyrhizobium erythrophlei]
MNLDLTPPGAPIEQEQKEATEALDAGREALDSAAAISSALWLSYLFLSFYLAIAVGAVTHSDLLFENAVRLPFLSIELPLVAFFAVTPILFLIMHLYVLTHFVLLDQKAQRFIEVLYERFPAAGLPGMTDEECRVARERVRKALSMNIFIQFMVGPDGVRNGYFGALLTAIAWITLLVLPLILLLGLQIQFLPFHETWVTWEHRFVLVVDIAFIWCFWEQIGGKPLVDGGVGTSIRWGRALSSLIVCVAIIWFSWAVATFPSEWQGAASPSFLRAALFEGPIDPNTHRRTSIWTNSLVLPRLNIYDLLKVDDPKKSDWRKYLLSVRGRDLRGAIFDDSFLERTDARGAELQGASFSATDLRSVSLNDAHLQGADLSNANLAGASAIRAEFAGASLIGANLRGANFSFARLQAANLSWSILNGSIFQSADLRAAKLFGAQIRGVSFVDAQLQGAIFDEARGSVVSLDRALLWRASFRKTTLSQLFGSPKWLPLHIAGAAWGPKTYEELVGVLASVPADRREQALILVKALDCSNSGQSAACDPSVEASSEVAGWKNQITGLVVAAPVFEKSLAGQYSGLICNGEGDASAILRSLARAGVPQAGGKAKFVGMLATGPEVNGLVKEILDEKKCKIAAHLSDEDRSALATLLSGQHFTADGLEEPELK